MSDPAPFYSDLAEGPSQAHAVWAKAEDGVRLRVGIWPIAGNQSGTARGTVLLFPGRTEYIEKYGRAAGDLAERGFAMAAIDWRGQGLADRPLADPRMGHVEEFSDYQRDVQVLLDQARAAGLPDPYYLIAHSMGGCIALRALLQDLPVKAAMFSAPMWDIGMGALMRPAAWAMGWLTSQIGADRRYAPTTGPVCVAATVEFDGNTLTTDPEMLAYMQRQTDAHDSLHLGGPSIHWLFKGLQETRHLQARPRPAIPTITYLGTDESIVSPMAVRRVMSNWTGGKLVVIDKARHEIMMEILPTRTRFFDDAARLFSANP